MRKHARPVPLAPWHLLHLAATAYLWHTIGLVSRHLPGHPLLAQPLRPARPGRKQPVALWRRHCHLHTRCMHRMHALFPRACQELSPSATSTHPHANLSRPATCRSPSRPRPHPCAPLPRRRLSLSPSVALPNQASCILAPNSRAAAGGAASPVARGALPSRTHQRAYKAQIRPHQTHSTPGAVARTPQLTGILHCTVAAQHSTALASYTRDLLTSYLYKSAGSLLAISPRIFWCPWGVVWSGLLSGIGRCLSISLSSLEWIIPAPAHVSINCLARILRPPKQVSSGGLLC